MTITIQHITDREQWNDFLQARQLIEAGVPGHLLQSYEWGKLSQYLGSRIYRLGALENGHMLGAMQLIVSPIPMPLPLPGLHPHWLYCARGPTVERPDSPALAALINHAHTIAAKERAVVLRLEPNIADDNPDSEHWLAAYHTLGFHTNPFSIHERRSWVLDIRPDAEQLLASFKMTWRQNVRVAERKGVIVREAANEADFDAYYNLLQITSQRDGFFIHSKDYHQQVLSTFAAKGDAVLYLAEHEGEAIAAKMLLRFGDCCWDMFGASSNNKRNLKATYLLQYRCIQWAKDRGCSYFDFRAIPEVLEPGEAMWGVYEYKKGFGGFSRLHMQTQDYVYRPLIYTAWRRFVAMRRVRHHAEHKKIELERAARGKNET